MSREQKIDEAARMWNAGERDYAVIARRINVKTKKVAREYVRLGRNRGNPTGGATAAQSATVNSQQAVAAAAGRSTRPPETTREQMSAGNDGETTGTPGTAPTTVADTPRQQLPRNHVGSTIYPPGYIRAINERSAVEYETRRRRRAEIAAANLAAAEDVAHWRRRDIAAEMRGGLTSAQEARYDEAAEEADRAAAALRAEDERLAALPPLPRLADPITWAKQQRRSAIARHDAAFARATRAADNSDDAEHAAAHAAMDAAWAEWREIDDYLQLLPA